MEQKPVEIEVNPVSIDIHGTSVITIPFDMYNSLVEIKGRYEEIKDGEEENNQLMEEYKELLVIKGKYEELSGIFEPQFIHDEVDPNIFSSPLKIEESQTETNGVTEMEDIPEA